MEGRVLREGRVGVRKKKGTEQRYFALFPDSLKYYADAESCSSQPDQPKGSISLLDVASVELVEGGWRVSLHDGNALTLEGVQGASDCEGWVQELRGALETFHGEVTGGVSVVYQGDVELLKTSGAVEPRHFVILEDRFQYYSSQADFDNREKPRAEVPLELLLGVKVEDDVVTLGLDSRSLAFRAAGKKEAQGWAKALDAARSRHASALSSQEAPADADEIMHEGTLAMKLGGKRTNYHFVLLPEHLRYYRSQREAAQGRPHEGEIVLEGIEDLEVEDTHLVIHAGGQELVLEETAKGDLQGWVDAFSRILETDEPPSPPPMARRESFQTSTDLADGPTRCVHEGPLLLEASGRLEPRHVVLYGDKIDFFGSQADSDSGGSPVLTVMNGDVRSVRVQEDALLVGLDAGEMHLQLPQGADIEAWINALRSVMDPDAQDDDSSQASPAPGLWSPGSPPTSAGSPQQRPPKHGDLPIAREMADPRVDAWLDSFYDDQSYYHGVLWLQKERKLAPRFCVLFGDRIDSWDSPLSAARQQPHNLQPEGRIMLNDVRGLAVIGNGFVLNYRGRKMGIHVGDATELQEWSSALLSVLDPGSDGGRARTSGGCAKRYGPSAPNSTLNSARTNSALNSARQTAPGSARSWVPRVANLQSPRRARASLEESASGSAGYPDSTRGHQRHLSMPSSTPSTIRANEARKQACRRRDPKDPAGVSAAKAYRDALNGRHEDPSNFNPVVKNADTKPMSPKLELAGKINQRAENVKGVASSRSSLADKVSGAHRVVPPRSDAVTQKITGSAPSTGMRSPRGDGPIAGKVNTADRAPFRSPSAAASQNMAGKITGGSINRSPRAALTGKITDA